MAIQKTLAIILRKREIRETSILLNFYTRDFGRIKALIKGIRNPQPQFGASFELFTLNRIVFYEKRLKDVFVLSQCELIDYFPHLREDLERLAYASYFAELIDTVTPLADRNENLFDIFLNSLKLLSGPGSAKRITRVFEIKLLDLLGIMPELKKCANCGASVDIKESRFSLRSGGIVCNKCLRQVKATRPVLAGTVNFIERVTSAPFEKVSRIKVSKDVGRELERLLRDFINYHLDIKLKSTEFLTKVGL